MQSEKPLGMKLWVAAIIGATFAVTTAYAQPAVVLTWYVDDMAPSGGNGSSWPEAFHDLQDALLEAGNNTPVDEDDWNEIWVAAGSGQGYKPTDLPAVTPASVLRTISFDMQPQLRIFGGFEGYSGIQEIDLSQRDPVANVTILTGQLTIPTPECPDVNCFVGASCDCADCRDDLVCVVLPDCCLGAWDVDCRALARQLCPFYYNSYHVVTALNLGLVQTARLSGFTITGGKAEGNIGEFTNNFETFGGGILITGPADAIPDDKVSPVIARCTLTDNYGVAGGGVHVTGYAAPIFLACSFIGNDATEGGGMHVEPADPNFPDIADTPEATLINCLFAFNTADTHGGAIDADSIVTTVDVINCTLAENSAVTGGGAVWSALGSQVTIDNSILWGNDPNEIEKFAGGVVIVEYSNVRAAPTWPGTGNQSWDPCFVDLSVNDFRLTFASPLIDIGNPDETVIPLDEFDIDDDMGFPVERTPGLDMIDRILDGPPFGGTAIVDMGAFEYLCLGEITGDGLVGIVDFLDLLAAWGPNPGHLADLDGDGIVFILDLLALLGNWGYCPFCMLPAPSVPTLEEELADACLTEDEWDEYEDVMTDEASSQADKDRYDCWMRHYITDCNKCTCPPTCPHGCPNPDPFR